MTKKSSEILMDEMTFFRNKGHSEIFARNME